MQLCVKMKMRLFSWFGFWLFALCSLSVTTGQSNLICSPQPIVALAGDGVILPCRLDPPTSASSRTVEWTRPGLDPEYVHVHQDGRLVHQSQNPLYNYRTALFVDQLINGNVSLNLFKVKISDAGKYKCFLPSLRKEASIQITVGAVSSPVITLAGTDRDKRGVVLQCESAGWYPEPEVLWLDGEGKLLSAGPTETVRGPDDLYTVSSRVTVEKRHSNSFTCRVQQRNINQTRETHIQVPEDFFLSTSCTASTAISVLFGLMFVFTVGFFVWKWRQNKKETENKEHKTEGEKNTCKSKNTEGQSQSDPLLKSQTEHNKAQDMGSRGKVTTHVSPLKEGKQFQLEQKSSPDSQEIATNSRVIFDEVDLGGKFVRLRNKSSENQLLVNCKVNIEVNGSTISYKFPGGFSLEAGNMVTIWASDGGGNHNPPTDVVWDQQKSWSAVEKVTLTSPMGEMMDRMTVSRP
ncbi:butyrophilin subfamily 3 member A2-like [Epinephelus moara]|uniref:butyrophilin subfamily 3 member A2-like n=1 Tax=Epinephelus moara TaxID=300413 RepID=UPI00214EE23A|nr:butyrophilin subfamily 3 member A2-like [Epinephelus moara]